MSMREDSPQDATSPGIELSRRGFLASVGGVAGGLAVGISFGLHPLEAGAVAEQGEINAWVYVRPDDSVLIRIVRAESGQGTLTGLAQLVTEELECDWVRVSTEYPSPSESLVRNRAWGSFSTVGSRSIRDSQDAMRRGGAIARILLVQAAARTWGVSPEECTVHRGIITHTPTNRKTVYGRVAYAAAQLRAPDPASIQLKDPKTWKIAGQRMLRLDTFQKTNGGQDYGSDLNFKGIYHAAIKACPVPGGRLKRFEPKEAQERPGIQKIVRIGNNAVAVIADRWWRAHSALGLMPIEWDYGPNASVQQADIDARLRAALTDMPTATGHHHGGTPAAIAQDIHESSRRVDASYSYPAQHHATMEPMSATARWTRTGCAVWAPTQDAEAALAAVAAVAELPIDKCEFHRMTAGGSFGRRAYHDVIVQAVQIARSMPGSVIKLAWSREEDMLHGPIHPPSTARLTARLARNGQPEGLHLRIAGALTTLPRNPYDPPVNLAAQRALYLGLLPEPAVLPNPAAFELKGKEPEAPAPTQQVPVPTTPEASVASPSAAPTSSATPATPSSTAPAPEAKPAKKGGFFSFLFGGGNKEPEATSGVAQPAPATEAPSTSSTPATPPPAPITAPPAAAPTPRAAQADAVPRTTAPLAPSSIGALLAGNDSTSGYRFGQLLIDHVQRDLHAPTGWWRGANLNPNTFYLESFIDEMAAASAQDPLALRRKLLEGNPKRLAVLDAVARQAGWGNPAPAGVHRGLAQVMGMGSYLAACAEISVGPQGQLKIHRFVVAIDCGLAVNPQQIEAQVESSIAFGLSAALYGKLSFQNGAVQQQNLDSYHVLRLADMPAVQTLVMPSGGFWGGVSEPATALAAPALCNAIFAASGKRIRNLPLGNQLSA